MGLGGGSTFVPLLTIAMADVPPRDAGLASGIMNVSMQLGAALGLALLGALADARTGARLADGASHAAALLSGYHLAFALAAGLRRAGLLLSLLVLARRRNSLRPCTSATRRPSPRRPEPARRPAPTLARVSANGAAVLVADLDLDQRRDWFRRLVS